MGEQKKKIVYYAGCFANYYDPEIGKSFIEVMERNGFEVIIPDEKCCGMPMLANGNVKGAAKNVKFNLKSLTRAASPGYDILTTCPSCNLMLRSECVTFFDSEEARFVSEHIYDASEYLNKLNRKGELNTKFGRMDLKVFYHAPCHMKVQDLTYESVNLLKLIPGLSVVKVNTACCGMGGSYGMKKVNYDLAIEIAGKVWEEVKTAQPDKGVTECGGCKLQIEAGTGINVVHPQMLLREAYGSY